MVLVLLLAFSALITCSVFQPSSQGRSVPVEVLIKSPITSSPTTVAISPFFEDADDELSQLANALVDVTFDKPALPRPTAPAPRSVRLRPVSPPTPAVKRRAEHDDSRRPDKKSS
jgi:hypothetical protein